MIVLDTTIVNVALPYIQHDLHFSQGSLTWVINGFLVSFGSLLLLAGRLGDLIGRKTVFLAGLTVFTLASLACGLAPDSGALIAARFVQGVGAALQASVILAIIVTEFPEPADRTRAMSAYVFTAVAGGSLGLLAGGFLTEALNWHWIFFVNIPIGIAALLAGRRLIPNDHGLGIGEGIDWLGSVLVTGSVAAAVYGIIQVTSHGWGSLHVWIPMAAATTLMAAFLTLESRIANPIMPLRILRNRGLVVSSLVRAFMVSGMYGIWFLGTLYLEKILGYGAVDTGLAFLPWTLTVAALALGINRRLTERFGVTPVLIGGLAMAMVGMLIMAFGSAHSSFFPLIFFAMFAMGLGIGNSFTPLMTIAMAKVPQQDAGLGSGIVNVSQQVSAALGLALLATIATNHTHSLINSGVAVPEALLSGYHLAFLFGAGAILVGLIIAALMLRPSQLKLGEEDEQLIELEAALESEMVAA